MVLAFVINPIGASAVLSLGQPIHNTLLEEGHHLNVDQSLVLPDTPYTLEIKVRSEDWYMLRLLKF